MRSFENICKRFGAVQALDSCSFERGRMLDFLGPNGAGKTTTMRAVFETHCQAALSRTGAMHTRGCPDKSRGEVK